jgi:hypothetical protein
LYAIHIQRAYHHPPPCPTPSSRVIYSPLMKARRMRSRAGAYGESHRYHRKSVTPIAAHPRISQLSIMTSPCDEAMTQILQMMSSMGLSPNQLCAALANPERMMELIRGSSHAEHTPMHYGEDEIVSQINEARAQSEAEARLPPEKLRLSQCDELEAENREVEKQMIQSARDGAVLQTFVGQDQYFSTTPIEQLEKSACWEQVIVVCADSLLVSLQDMFAHQVHMVCICSVIWAICFIEQFCVRGDILFAGPYSKQAIVFCLLIIHFMNCCPQSNESTYN